jgi:hypothetical protein
MIIKTANSATAAAFHSCFMFAANLLFHGFIAAASIKRAGKVSDIEAREIVTSPSSSGEKCDYTLKS